MPHELSSLTTQRKKKTKEGKMHSHFLSDIKYR